MSCMKKNGQPDAITEAACRWLLSGGAPGAYTGPDPGHAHGLSPLLSKEMDRKDISLTAAAGWFRHEHIIRPVLELIAKEGTVLWAVKGFDLARSVYPFPGSRPMADADLFVEERNRQRILNAFEQSGWTRESPGDGIFNADIVSELKMYRHSTMVELHTHIFYFPATFPGKLPVDLFENGRPLEPGLMGFAWHNALLMVLIHMLTNSEMRPVWWVDTCLLCKKVSEAGSWNRFAWNASETKLGHALASLLVTAAEVLGAPIPGKAIEVLNRVVIGREDVVENLKAWQKRPTLLNLKHLAGWKKVSWSYALLWLVLTGQHPLRRK